MSGFFVALFLGGECRRISRWFSHFMQCVGVAMIERFILTVNGEHCIQSVSPTAVVVECNVNAIAISPERIFEEGAFAHAIFG